MRCLECGAEMRWTDEPITEEYRGENITVSGIGRYVCDQCGNDEMAAKDAERLARSLASEYAHARGLLSPDEIKEFRTSIGITQKEFERMVGVSSPTVSRWESGAMQQSKPVDNLIRAMRDHREVLYDSLERAEIHPSYERAAIKGAPAARSRAFATAGPASKRPNISVGQSCGTLSTMGSVSIGTKEAKEAL